MRKVQDALVWVGAAFVLGCVLGALTAGCGSESMAQGRGSSVPDFVVRDYLRAIPVQEGTLYIYYARQGSFFESPVMVYAPKGGCGR